jgi:tetratricopeptide (TPR) repeat protein
MRYNHNNPLNKRSQTYFSPFFTTLANMDRCAKLNNAGASDLVNGMYANAVDAFTGSLRIVKSALSVLAAERELVPTQHPLEMQKKCSAVIPATRLTKPHSLVGCRTSSLRGLYVSPLFLSECADYERYETTVEASVAIMFNLALAHHLNALSGYVYGQEGMKLAAAPVHGLSTLEQAIALYELAYTVQMQEDAELSVEFTMAIINNLGHIHRLIGDEEKSSQCFRHLLSTIVFLQSYGGDQSSNCSVALSDTFVYSISHLILRETAAAAA